MHRVETGDLEAVADVKSDDEIGHLARAFNRMTNGLRREALVRLKARPQERKMACLIASDRGVLRSGLPVVNVNSRR